MSTDKLKEQILQRVGSRSAEDLRYINTPKGHGFAAEEMNHLMDSLLFRDAVLTGNLRDPSTGKIIKNGWDRVVDGQYIQSKFCQKGSDCIRACIDQNGHFKYLTPDGNFQKIEVPRDKYDEAVAHLENLIQTGKIKNITDPAQAKELLIKSIFTYDQAEKVTQAGTIPSLVFDAVNGVIISSAVILVSGLITYAYSIWSGDDESEALDKAIDIAVSVGGMAFFTSVISAQLSRTGLKKALSSGSLQVLKSDSMRSISKHLRSGLGVKNNSLLSKRISEKGIAVAATIIVLSAIELMKFLSTRISGAQAFKNIVILSITTVAGRIGAKLGAAAGAKVGAKFGMASGNPWVILATTFVGSIAGGVIAGAASGMAIKAIMDQFIEDDAVQMLRIFERAIGELAKDYLLSPSEIEQVIVSIRENGDISGMLAYMFYVEKTANSAFSVAYIISEYEIDNVRAKRMQISVDLEQLEFSADRKLLETLQA